jgi:hypothetical protein
VLAGPTVAPASAGAIYLKSCKYFGNSRSPRSAADQPVIALAA